MSTIIKGTTSSFSSNSERTFQWVAIQLCRYELGLEISLGKTFSYTVELHKSYVLPKCPIKMSYPKKFWVGHFDRPLNCTRNKLPFPHLLISHSWFSQHFFREIAKFASREDFKFEDNYITVYKTKYLKGCFRMKYWDTKETVCHRPSIMMILETTKH